MRKIIAVFIVLLMVLLVVSVGCAKQEVGKKTVSSRPVSAKEKGAPAEVETEPSDLEYEETYEEPEEETRSVVSAGQADCEQLSSTDVGDVFGGTWSKTDDCPIRPAMPAGVDVCRCDYDGPRQVYVNIETQLYDDADEAEQVYNMYCQGTAEESEVGTYSCRMPKTDNLRPNYVYFLKDNYFVKVSCLGGSCPMDGVVELAKKVDAKI